MSKSELTAKQSLFVKEYLVDLNATQAAIRAGYSEKTAQEQSSRLLSNVIVAEAIQKAMDKRCERLDISADSVLQEIAKLGFANIQNLYDKEGNLIPLHELPASVAAAITEINTDSVGKDGEEVILKRKYKLADKGQNLDRLGKHLKLFGDNAVTINNNSYNIAWEFVEPKQVEHKPQDIIEAEIIDVEDSGV